MNSRFLAILDDAFLDEFYTISADKNLGDLQKVAAINSARLKGLLPYALALSTTLTGAGIAGRLSRPQDGAAAKSIPAAATRPVKPAVQDIRPITPDFGPKKMTRSEKTTFDLIDQLRDLRDRAQLGKEGYKSRRAARAGFSLYGYNRWLNSLPSTSNPVVTQLIDESMGHNDADVRMREYRRLPITRQNLDRTPVIGDRGKQVVKINPAHQRAINADWKYHYDRELAAWNNDRSKEDSANSSPTLKQSKPNSLFYEWTPYARQLPTHQAPIYPGDPGYGDSRHLRVGTSRILGKLLPRSSGSGY